ncbi:hypothetical protein TRICI_003527 [Trichomonascus ciferrii]|uniref:C2H2-type domain-containing protein n=1 Tax=Trichomonascus ciferrii TaxID=44093 RepID=A0A642V3J5_9ASCO|nr:hypothetical protein TRICI_003527 [Trichomonascus ciferrii]
MAEVDLIEPEIKRLKRRYEVEASLMEAKPFECEVCALRFQFKSRLEAHRKTHEGNAKRPDTSNLRRHQRVHGQGVGPTFECEVCHQQFGNRDHLKRHKVVHTNERPYACNTCGRAFARKPDMTKHEKIHTDQKPYECEVCGLRFRRAGHRTVHARRHTKERPYSCQICSRVFTRSDSLLNHYRRLHPGAPNYTEPGDRNNPEAALAPALDSLIQHNEKTPDPPPTIT